MMESVKDVLPNLGIAPAAGKATTEAVKQKTSGMTPLPRIAIVASTAVATAVDTEIVLEQGKQVIEKKSS